MVTQSRYHKQNNQIQQSNINITFKSPTVMTKSKHRRCNFSEIINNNEFKRNEDHLDSEYNLDLLYTESNTSWTLEMEPLDIEECKNEEALFKNHQYGNPQNILNTKQGTFYKVSMIDMGFYGDAFVSVKKYETKKYGRNIPFRETKILRYLTEGRSSPNYFNDDYIIQYLEYFESHEASYLVTEHVDFKMNLAQFVDESIKKFNNKKMKLKHYQKIIKYIFWQLCLTIRWLHRSMNC